MNSITTPAPHADAADQHFLEIPVNLPQWLENANEQVCSDYQQYLNAYRTAALRLDAGLAQVLPTFEAFTRDQVAARIEADLYAAIDPDTVMVSLPLNMYRDYQIDPQYGRVESYNAAWLPYTEREYEQLSICELARRNFDREDDHSVAQFKWASIQYPDGHAVIPELTGEYLSRIIPDMDITQRYRTLLGDAYRVGTTEQDQGLLEPDILVAPAKFMILLDAFCGLTRKRLSEQGHRMLTTAAFSRSRADIESDLDLDSEDCVFERNRIVFKPGEAVSGERSDLRLHGVVAIRDRETNRTVIYLSGVPHEQACIEGDNPQQAHDRLIQQLIKHPELIDYLAERTMDPGKTAHHASYIRQALNQRFHSFLTCVPDVELQLAHHLVVTQRQMLFVETLHEARTNADFERIRDLEHTQRVMQLFKGFLGFVPGLGTLISIHEGLQDLDAAAKGSEQGQVLLALGSAALNMFDVVLSVVPGAAIIRVLSRSSRLASKARRFAPVLKKYRIEPFKGYEVRSVSLDDAIVQSGVDAGTVLKDGQLWIQREGLAYPVYRRSGEQTLRLQKNAIQGYEPPVRLDAGRWVYHTDVGLKGGGSRIAENIIVAAHLRDDPTFTYVQARELLDQFEFPSNQYYWERIFANDYALTRQVPDWAHAHRRPAPVATPEPSSASTADGAGAPLIVVRSDVSQSGGSVLLPDEPQPGISGAKRKDPPTVQAEPSRASTHGLPVVADTGVEPAPWQQWGREFAVGTKISWIERDCPIFRVRKTEGPEFIFINRLRYDILPGTPASRTPTVVLRNPACQLESFEDLVRGTGESSEPRLIKASYRRGEWHVEGSMAADCIQEFITQARPGLTLNSYRALSRNLYNMVEPAHTRLTSGRMLELEAVLNAWTGPSQTRVAAHNDPLTLLAASRLNGRDTLEPYVEIATAPIFEPLARLDLLVDSEPLQALLERTLELASTSYRGHESAGALISALMRRAGYEQAPDPKGTLWSRALMVFSRPGHRQKYLVHTKTIVSSRISYPRVNLEAALPLSEQWLRDWQALRPDVADLGELVQASEQGHLVRLVGGVIVDDLDNWAPKGQVIVQRLPDEL